MVIELKEPGKEPERDMRPQPPSMLCPVCNVTLTMSNRQDVEIDYCPRCRGVWLDRGELDKIIERSVSVVAPQPPVPEPRGHAEERGYGREKHGGKHGYRRKSWLHELFD